ncbi:c-type cytochrome [Cupriavidus sp. amp6]|uniref:c-type cytochrome n=1 Tax=Cupriavidus sp. amp6 TaxID=388051 RepID=UPI0004100AD8|nr:c-type cytochrome [Cupriavidus sp. amp6]
MKSSRAIPSRWCAAILSGAALLPGAAAADVPAPRAGEVADTARATELLKRQAALPRRPWSVPDPATIPTGEAGNEIRHGKTLLEQTARSIGPNATDPGKRFAGNNLNCVQCHAGPSGLPGTKPYALPLVNVVHEYPKLDVKSMKVITLQDRIAGMVGKGPTGGIPTDSTEMRAIVAYLKWLGSGGKPDTRMGKTGLYEAVLPARSVNQQRGEQVYRAQCIACHQVDGKGVKHADFARGGGYSFPPIAGNDSFDDGGHISMVPLMTRFLLLNMPYGASEQNRKLSLEDAYDVAAYVV